MLEQAPKVRKQKIPLETPKKSKFLIFCNTLNKFNVQFCTFRKIKPQTNDVKERFVQALIARNERKNDNDEIMSFLHSTVSDLKSLPPTI